MHKLMTLKGVLMAIDDDEFYYVMEEFGRLDFGRKGTDGGIADQMAQQATRGMPFKDYLFEVIRTTPAIQEEDRAAVLEMMELQMRDVDFASEELMRQLEQDIENANGN